MLPTRTAFGMWGAGRFMHFGEALDDDRFIALIRLAYEKGIRTFLTADVYGAGEADALLSRALEKIPRDSYCLVGAIGHDFYEGERQGSKGYPRFTDPALRQPHEFAGYLRMASEKSLQRCGVDKFDLLLLHNPDALGYTSEAVWEGMAKLKELGLTDRLGIAPGPANGFTLDLILCLERFQALIDWAMIILNPLEPWPGRLCLAAAKKTGTEILTRVVDYGGLFHDDVKPNHAFGARDHRTFRPAGWVESGSGKMDQMRAIAEAHGLTMLQLACIWNLQHPGVASVVPTMIQEAGAHAKPIERKVEELASLPNAILTPDEFARIAEIGDNRNRMSLKGASAEHVGPSLPDRWSLNDDLIAVAARWEIDPARDLAYDQTAA
ncbi:MAG TPA: aldo/keto reductase [Chthoniobacterales bacterium]|nr:aldo/keto reductase [Chthoniobacterales bacterium]